MRPIVPSGDFPENVQPVKFEAPPDMKEKGINDAIGLAHRDPENLEETVALEFMFELTQEELQVLKHEPYITIVLLGDHLHPFSVQTSYPFEEKYKELNNHTHRCVSHFAHEEPIWWRCDNPRHDAQRDRIRECDECFAIRSSAYLGPEGPAPDPVNEGTENADPEEEMGI